MAAISDKQSQEEMKKKDSIIKSQAALIKEQQALNVLLFLLYAEEMEKTRSLKSRCKSYRSIIRNCYDNEDGSADEGDGDGELEAGAPMDLPDEFKSDDDDESATKSEGINPSGSI
eukprot:CAMPEP_0201567298 /NCGR_PEP_ID=MMETSP0190_2-20130828/7759_1 /ASSEMBLY_ACC=CAM_ASM_000263 /TAXON_ID=37353 /ORGANISM="Rosalina sp." /LENGTH=115 /DNA_ID=CAMNT_0047987139 /DNA_START=81 /DNA_END=428 /DNA_ORIENTATION=-